MLSQLIIDLNVYTDVHEELDTKLQQADALVRVGESMDIDLFSQAVLRHYMLTLMEVIEEATQRSERLSKELCRLSEKLKQLSTET